MLMDCDDPLEVHKFCSMLPAFEFQARPVVPVADAIRVELEAMAWRDSLKGIHDKFCQEKKAAPARSEEREEGELRQSLSVLYASRQDSCDTQNHPSICCL